MRRAKAGVGKIVNAESQPRSSNTPSLVEGPSLLSSSHQQSSADLFTSPADPICGFSQLSRQSGTGIIGPFPLRETIWHPGTIATNSKLPFDNPSCDPSQSSDLSIPFEGPNIFGYQQTMTSGLLLYGPIYSGVGAGDDDLENDPEATKQDICIAPTPDPNTTDNALPFVLQSYARWIAIAVFEPSKAVLPLKESIANKFMNSPSERSRIILLSNVMGSLGKSLELGHRETSLITYLRTEAHQNINKFIVNRAIVEREVDIQNALEALDLIMELILVQRYSGPTSTVVGLMEAAAPVFRRACPEPLDQYVNLPRAVFSPAINIRHFATSDVLISITTGRPMLFRYDVDYPQEILKLMKDGKHGMQWLHGVPDEYIVLLARINTLSEEYGTNISPQCIAELEDQICGAEFPSERSANPTSMIWRFTVRECWKLIVQMYLYMFLCRTTTDDPRVLKLVKTYVRLTEAVQPGRNPDAFLYIPMIITGVSAYREQDQAAIKQRMLGLQECVKPGSCGYDMMDILADLWSRTKFECRPAVWADLRLSVLRVAGV